MKDISILGTSSDAGKSTLAFAITYLLHKRGIKVAPFKAQNVSNNSQVTDAGGEVAIPQYFAANAIGIKTSPDINPILLKSGAKGSSHIILNGKSIKEQNVWQYYRDINALKPIVKQAFKNLKKEYDCVVAEGAGSPVELNLMKQDLSNIYVAKTFHTKIILVADIERGGVFASIYGVYHLLPKKLRKNVIGVIVNKFRGDMRLFDEGVQIIEKKFHLKVLGVVPFKPFNLGFEDSQSLMNYTQESAEAIIKVGVIKFPHISNFTDFEPLILDTEVELTFINSANEIDSCDVVVLPGSKRVVDDLAWLKKNNFHKKLKTTTKAIIGICGGYEMLFENIVDAKKIESENIRTKGLAYFKGDITFKKKKVVKKATYKLFNSEVKGYEIHNGVTKKLAQRKKNIYGTFVHALFDSDAFRNKLFKEMNAKYKGYNFLQRKEESIRSFTQHIEKHIDMDYICSVIKK